jgi:hypothetical protein
MGKLIKLSFLVVFAIIMVIVVSSVIGGISHLGNNTGTPKQGASAMPGKAEYDKIQVGDPKTGKGGMTLAEVEKILGQPTSEQTGQSGKTEMDVYTFATSAGPNSIIITFLNGHASGKTQSGLE